MYLVSIVLLLFVFPALSVIVEVVRAAGAADTMFLVGKWFVFWAAGVRLFIAGITQVARPQFTAGIFDITDQAALAIVREVGFGNLSMGAIGLLSLARPDWLEPAAIAGGLYYGLAGVGHLVRRARNFKEQIALVTDLFAFVVLAAFVATRGF